MIVFQKMVTRQDLRSNPLVYYVFGDNARRVGHGGQAAEMRGEPNALGVATKWAPSNSPGAYFSEERDDEQTALLTADLAVVARRIGEGHLVIWPADGIGTGLADLVHRWPRGIRLIEAFLLEHRVSRHPFPGVAMVPDDARMLARLDVGCSIFADHYGSSNLPKAIEEAGEFVAAASKYLGGDRSASVADNMAEETVDNFMMARQTMHRIGLGRVRAILEEKLARTTRRVISDPKSRIGADDPRIVALYPNGVP